MSGYNVLIPDSSRDLHPELMLPIMDGLQQLQETPVVMSMSSIRDMYQHTRHVSHGSYEIFQFYVRDLLRKNNIDFGVSVGLSAILEDGSIQELHHVMEECGIPNLIYLNARDTRVVDKLEEIGAAKWHCTHFVCSSEELCRQLNGRGIGHALHTPLGTSTRIFFSSADQPGNAPFPLKLDDERLATGYEVSFTGRYSPRRDLILAGLLDTGISLAVFGDQAWENSTVSSIFRGGSHYLEDTNTIYNYSRICLDLPFIDDQFDDYISSRVPDCLAAGGVLLMQENPALTRLLGNDANVLFYDRPELLVDRIKTILADDRQVCEAAQRVGAMVRDNYSWDRCLHKVWPQLELCLLRRG